KPGVRLGVRTSPTPDPNVERFYGSTYYANRDSEYLADGMSEVMTSRAVADEVKRELATTSTPLDVDIDAIMTATRAKKTHRFIDITVTTPTFDQGALIAGSIARVVNDKAHLAQYLQALTAYNTQMTIVTPPVTHRANTVP